MESAEQPKQKTSPELTQLRTEWDKAVKDLEHFDEIWTMRMTGIMNTERTEKFLKENYDLLSERQRQFLLLSLRIKKLQG